MSMVAMVIPSMFCVRYMWGRRNSWASST